MNARKLTALANREVRERLGLSMRGLAATLKLTASSVALNEDEGTWSYTLRLVEQFGPQVYLTRTNEIADAWIRAGAPVEQVMRAFMLHTLSIEIKKGKISALSLG